MQAQRIWGRSALLVAMVGLFSSCTIGDTDDVDGELIGFASNQKLRNGCLPGESVAVCAEKKAISPEYACLYRQRVPDAYFRISYFTGSPPVEPNWVFERYAMLLPAFDSPLAKDDDAPGGTREVTASEISEIEQMELDTACSQYAYRWRLNGDRHLGTYVPTEMGCQVEGGIWRNGICVAW